MELSFQHYRRQTEKRLREYEQRLRECEARIRSLQRKIQQTEGEDRAAIQRILDDLQDRYSQAKTVWGKALEQVERTLSEGRTAIEAALATAGEVGTRSAKTARGLLKATRIRIRAVREGVKAGIQAAKEVRKRRRERG